MDQETLSPIMLTLAAATPVVGIAILLAGGKMASDAGEPLQPSLRRAAWILIAAGPLNWIVWRLLNNWLDAIGYRSVFGYALAAAVFFGMGWGTGFLKKQRRARLAQLDDPDANLPPDDPSSASSPHPSE